MLPNHAVTKVGQVHGRVYTMDKKKKQHRHRSVGVNDLLVGHK
jgi:hypothetical protein